MKKLLFIFLFFPLTSQAQSGDKNFIDQNYIEVTGKSEMEVTPDMIYLKIFLSEKDNKSKAPLAERENAMISKLNEIGIDITKDLLMKDISSNFKYYFLLKSDILLSKEYQLIVHDAKTASKVIIELEKLGISNVSLDKLDNSNMEKYRKDVKIDAIKAAKNKAESLATAIGQSVGRAIYIQELESNSRGTSAPVNSFVFKGMSDQLYGSRAADPEIDFEKMKIEYSILCRFELK